MEPVFANSVKRSTPLTGLDNDFFHEVKPGESLSAIVLRYYQPLGHQALMAIIGQIVRDNPQIRNPNLIYPRQLLRLRSPFRVVERNYSEVEDVFESNRIWQSLSETEKQVVTHHEGLLHAIAETATGIHGTAHGLAGALHDGKHLVEELIHKYASYKKGEITKGAYDYFRRTKLRHFQGKVGPTMNRWLYQESKASKIFRITQGEARAFAKQIGSGIEAGARPLSRQLGKLGKIAKFSHGIAVIGNVVDVGVAGVSIFNAWGTAEQNEVICEEGGGVLGSWVGTGAATLMFAFCFTGVGALGVAAVVGLSALGGHMGGKLVGKGTCRATGITGEQVELIAPLAREAIH